MQQSTTQFAPSGTSLSAPRLAPIAAHPATTALAVSALLVLAMLPVLRYPLPPLADYANHLARMQIIAAAGSDLDLAQYYRIDWQLIPNLAMDLIVPPLSRVFGIYAAGQVFTLICFAAIATGMFALNRALFARWSLMPLAGLPFLYNFVLLVGTSNYVLGIGLAMWALAAWVRNRERPLLLRTLIAAGFVTALFFCHLFAVGLFGLGMLAFESWRWTKMRGRPLAPRIVGFFTSGIAFILVPLLLLASPTSGLAGSTYWEAAGKIEGLQYTIEAYSMPIALALSAALLASGVWAWQRSYLYIHPLGFYLCVIGTVVFIAMPRMLFDSHMADQRLPIALLFMAIAATDLRLPTRTAGIAALSALAVMLGVRIAEVDRAWAAGYAEIADLKRSTATIARGSRVVIVSADPNAGYDAADFALTHAAALATLERSALTTRLFTVTGKQVLQLQPRWKQYVDQLDGAAPALAQFIAYTDRSSAPDEYIYWQRWPQRFDYVYLLYTTPTMPNPDPRRLTLMHEGNRFRLYRIVRDN